MNIIIVEYPWYSIYDNEKPDPNLIFENSCIIYDLIRNTFEDKEDQIFISLFSISAITSINKIIEDKNISSLLEDIFKSYNYIKKINCFTLLIHGKKDPLINYKHS